MQIYFIYIQVYLSIYHATLFHGILTFSPRHSLASRRRDFNVMVLCVTFIHISISILVHSTVTLPILHRILIHTPLLWLTLSLSLSISPSYFNVCYSPFFILRTCELNASGGILRIRFIQGFSLDQFMRNCQSVMRARLSHAADFLLHKYKLPMKNIYNTLFTLFKFIEIKYTQIVFIY